MRKTAHIPSKEIAEIAALGLELRQKHHKGGTNIGVARARDLKNRKNLSMRTIKRMYSYFKRHEIDKKAENFGNKEKPSAGYVAWLLWGGDPGYKWVKSIVDKYKTQQNGD